MGIQGQEGLVTGNKWLCQHPVTKGGSVKGVCGTMALGRWSTLRCQVGKLMLKCSH